MNIDYPTFEELIEIEEELNNVSNLKFPTDLKRCSDSFKQYIHEIVESYPRVSDEELLRLFYLAVYDGDEAARNKIIESNLRLVIYVAFKYVNTTKLEIDDLIQEGNIGLMECINRFEPEMNYKFSTFAFWYIKGYILNAIGDTGRTIRIPRNLYYKLKEIEDVSSKWYETNGYYPSDEELSFLTGISPKIVRALRQSKSVTSLDKTFETCLFIDEDEVPFEVSILDTIEDEDDDIFEKVLKSMRRESLEKVMRRHLTDREFFVLTERFGFYDGEEKYLEVVGKKMNLTRERVRQIEAKALRKLRLRHHLKILKGYL